MLIFIRRIILFGKDFNGFCIQHHPNVIFLHELFQCVRDIKCMVRHRKDPVSSFDLKAKSRLFEKAHNIFASKASVCTIKKLWISKNAVKEFIPTGGICKITSALACDKKLLSKLLIMLNYCCIKSVFCKEDGSHHS